jgi:hypothetical protein
MTLLRSSSSSGDADGSSSAVTVATTSPAPVADTRHDGRVYLILALAALAIAALSLTFPSTPAYDPWAWIIWGREIVHGTLITNDGPSWKPLPVVFTTIFAPLGSAAPNLWLLVSRWGAALAVLMCFKVAARVAAFTRGAVDPAAGWLARAAGLAPAWAGGLLAAWAMAATGDFASEAARGYSEGLAIAFTLIAIERAAAGHHRQAFALGTVIAWERPESWIAWGIYGIWLMWRDRGSRALVIGLALLTLAVWFVPQRLGSSSFTSSVSRAQVIDKGSPQTTAFPFWSELWQRALPSVLGRGKLLVLLGMVAGAWDLVRRRVSFREWLHADRYRAGRWICLLALAGVAWWLVISIETQDGFSGNVRYVRIGSALVDVAAGAALGWGAYALRRLVARLRDRNDAGSRAPLGAATSPLVALMLLVAFALLPTGWIGSRATTPSALRHDLHYQALLRQNFSTLISKAGGYQAINRCGHAITENYQVTMLAWYLHLPIDKVGDSPAVNAAGEAPVPAGHWPKVVFQAASVDNNQVQPFHRTISGWKREGARYTVTASPTVTLYRECPGS